MQGSIPKDPSYTKASPHILSSNSQSAKPRLSMALGNRPLSVKEAGRVEALIIVWWQRDALAEDSHSVKVGRATFPDAAAEQNVQCEAFRS